MKIWISTYRHGANLPTGWQGQAEPPASLQMLLMRLPENDKHYSLIIKRCLYDRCMLAMHCVNEHGADLVIDELEEEQARSLALAYLQQHDDLCRDIAQAIQGQSADAKADVTAIEKTLLQYIEKYPVKSDGVMIDTVNSSLHDVAAISKVAELLRNYYFSTSDEEKLVLSDNGRSFTFDQADIFLNGQEIPKERERKSNKVLFAVGSILALTVIVYAVVNLCGTDSKKKAEPPTEQPVKPVNLPAPQPKDNTTAEPPTEQPAGPVNPPAPQPKDDATAEPPTEQPAGPMNPPAPQPKNDTTAEPPTEQPAGPVNPPTPQPKDDTSPSETTTPETSDYENASIRGSRTDGAH